MFDRLERLIGRDKLNILANTHVLLVGIGGVGGFALEALIRSGIGHITVVDGDIIDKTNLNRQIVAKNENVGLSKTDEWIKRACEINPNVDITGFNFYISEENIKKLNQYDYIIDACDDSKAKMLLLKYAKEHNIKIIWALGTGKRLDPGHVILTTLGKTKNDPFAKKMRELVKKEGIDSNIPVIYSEEPPLNNDRVIASAIFVPGVVGLYLAYYVIDDIIKTHG